MGGNSIKVGSNFTMGDLHRFAAATRGETGTQVNIKGKLVEKNGVKTLELYASKNSSGFWGNLFNPTRTIKKQALANEALHLALTNSYGEKVADAVFVNMEKELHADGGHLNHQLLADVELEASRLATAQRQPKQAGPQQVGQQRPGPRSAPGSAPQTFPRADSIPEKYHRDVNPTEVEDEDDDMYENPADPTSRHYQGPVVTDDVDTDDEDDDVYNLQDDELTDAVEEANDLIDRTRIDLTQDLPTDEEDDDEDMYDVPPDHEDFRNNLPDPPTTPPGNKPRAWSIEDMPDAPTHKPTRALDDIALQSESALEARLARLQAGRPRSASAPPNNRVQGMLFAKKLERKPEKFSALLQEARARAGSDLLGDGGFHAGSGISRFDGPVAVAKYFAKHQEPISHMSEQRKHDLAVEAVIDFINLPDPSTKAVDK